MGRRGLALGLLGVASVLVIPAGVRASLPYAPPDSRVIVDVSVPGLQAGDPRGLAEAKREAAEVTRVLYQHWLAPELKKLDEPAVRDVTRMVVALKHVGRPEGVLVIQGKVAAKAFEKHARECARLNPRVVVRPAGKGVIVQRPLATEGLRD